MKESGTDMYGIYMVSYIWYIINGISYGVLYSILYIILYGILYIVWYELWYVVHIHLYTTDTVYNCLIQPTFQFCCCELSSKVHFSPCFTSF